MCVCVCAMGATCYPFIILYAELFPMYTHINQTPYMLYLFCNFNMEQRVRRRWRVLYLYAICHTSSVQFDTVAIHYPLHSSDPISFYAFMRNVYKLTAQTLACFAKKKTVNYSEQFNRNENFSFFSPRLSEFSFSGRFFFCFLFLFKELLLFIDLKCILYIRTRCKRCWLFQNII